MRPSVASLSLLLLPVLLASACTQEEPTETTDPGPPPTELTVEDLSKWVDPMIGTDGSGNVLPGALVPHGMVRASPDTDDKAGAIAAYHYDADKLAGFSHTHLLGPGGSSNGYSQVLVMPYAGTITDALPDHLAPFSHDTEVAEPGYYAVTLDDSKIRVELTATAHAAVHRVTWPKGAQTGWLFDLGYSNGKPADGRIERVGKRVVRGMARYNVHPMLKLVLKEEPTADSMVFFHAIFDRDMVDSGAFRDGKLLQPDANPATGKAVGAWLGFGADVATVTMRIGISFIDEAQAEANLKAEVADDDFDTVRKQARQAWNRVLSRVKLSDGDKRAGTAKESEARRRIFYTALYHSFFQPADYTEVGGRFDYAADGKHNVHDGQGRRFYTDDWCMWDTFHTLHPLGTLIEPEIRGDIAWSMLHIYKEGGWLPKCTWNATGYSRVMTGNSAVPIIADSYVKGLRDFDADLAWQAVYKTLTQDNDNPGSDFLCGYLNLGTVPEYITLGWVPAPCDNTQSASMTLEYAQADSAGARFAEARGDSKNAAHFDARSANWKNQFNPEKGFMQARNADGSWVEPFDPSAYAVYFVEATSWIFTFSVPHDPEGLAKALGGDQAMVDKLDAFFAAGEFEISNEPSFHIPWMYGRVGRPDKAQDRLATVLAKDFDASPGGLPGNDDAGATSAWYVLNALGIYPLAPGDGIWELGAPMYPRAELWIPAGDDKGHALVIESPGAGQPGHRVTRAVLNGEELPALRVAHKRIARGGVLRLLP